MKNKLKFTVFFLVTTFILLLSSCQDEEISVGNEIKSSSYKLKVVTKSEIDQNQKITTKLEKFTSPKNLSSKNIYVDNLGLVIQTDDATYIENGNYHSYTFSTVQKETENIKNVLFSLNKDGDYDAYLVEYNYNKLELKQFNSKTKPSPATIKPINLDLKSLTSKYKTLWVCKYDYEWVGSGDLVGAENVKYQWVLVATSCAAIDVNVIDGSEDHNSDTGGGAIPSNPSSGGSGGGVVTAPKESHIDNQGPVRLSFVKDKLDVGGQQSRFLDSHDTIVYVLYYYLLQNNSSLESRQFGKELLEIVRTDTSFDLNAFYFTLNAQSNKKINNGLDEAFLLAMDQYMDADIKDIYNNDPDLIIYFGAHHIVKMARLKKLNPQWSYLKCYWEASKEVVHITLDVFGTVPVIGELADVTNGVLYVIEGDGLNATISIASAVPIAGWAAVSTKYAIKINEVYSIGTKVKLVWKVSGDLITFGSRSQLRKVLGLAIGDLRQAHHIIPWNKQSKAVIQKASKSQHAFHMNEALNGIPLENAVHNGSHARYDDLIQGYLNRIPDNATPDQCYEAVTDIINKVRTAIANNPNTHINQLIF
ncbi:AHH domain-containing protein [Flavobacterium sp. LPB0248]|uniref:AHH domain-containing protein n=1 Tax=Flavobacterium sp. LPB0248 TaxID=2614441 RepID=UPI0015A55B1B|nr:AHH domain-containing protein [Flavobacterium sp. LPB0248]QLC67555.1 AHH domain-containing protein [Flavobacterium sp. LPB0248]